jgi:hypothetical protein
VTTKRIASHLAPALMAVYGAVRYIDGHDGEYGPGPAWTVGHLFFLGALLLYGPVIADLRQRILTAGGTGTGTGDAGRGGPGGPGRARTITAAILTTITAVGLITFIRVAVLDIVVGLKAADAAEKSALSDQYADVPAVLPQPLYEIGPAFFMLGLIAMLAQYAIVRPHRTATAALSPALVLLGFVAIMADLNLLPLGALLIWTGLVPLTRPHHTPSHQAAHTPAAA